MMKKWIAMMLCLALMLAALPMSVFADPAAAEQAPPAATEQAPESTESAEQTEKAEEEEKKEERPKLEPLSPAQAATPTHKLPTKAARIQRLRYYIQWDHQNALEEEEEESLYGFCGLLASYQMYYRGINDWRLSRDGKDYFDEYAKRSVTGGGYGIRAYDALKNPPAETEEVVAEEPTAEMPAETTQTPAETTETPEVVEPAEPEKYTIAEILSQVTGNGSREVYNLLVCFERTDTAAGTIYGHVVFVYGIIDGIVYFTEGGDMFGQEAGMPMEATIANFSASYATWTDFEGVIVFGCKEYMDNCKVYTSNMFVSAAEPATLLTMPGRGEDVIAVRNVAAGERLQVIGLYATPEGEYFYEIYDDGTVCYADVRQMKPYQFLQEGYNLENPKLPQVLKAGQDMRLDGTVETVNYISQITVSILNQNGQTLQQVVRLVGDSSFDLYNWDMNKVLDFGTLEEGVYQLRIEAQSSNWYAFEGYLAKNLHQQIVDERTFVVGEETALPVQAKEAPVEVYRDGWVYENQTWYCYKDNVPLTGWQEADGIWYYLKEDGSVTTNWELVEGKLLLFSGTGAMRRGWVDSPAGRKYLRSDGTPATGWMKIDGQYYYFDAMGLLQDDYMRTTVSRMANMETVPVQESDNED